MIQVKRTFETLHEKKFITSRNFVGHCLLDLCRTIHCICTNWQRHSSARCDHQRNAIRAIHRRFAFNCRCPQPTNNGTPADFGHPRHAAKSNQFVCSTCPGSLCTNRSCQQHRQRRQHRLQHSRDGQQSGLDAGRWHSNSTQLRVCRQRIWPRLCVLGHD